MKATIKALASMTLSALALLTPANFSVGSAWAIDVPSADVKILSTYAKADTQRFTCVAKVHNDNDDDAQNVRVVVLLPQGVQVGSMAVSPTGTCAAGPVFFDSSVGINTQGIVTCSLGSMTVGEIRYVTVGTTAPRPGVMKTCGTFVWNNVPDPVHSNNFGVATAP